MAQVERPKHGEYRFFKLAEFDSPDLPGSGVNMQPAFVKLLDDARNMASVPFAILRGGGWRTPRYQKSISKATNSAHPRGWAADIACVSRARFEVIALALIMHGVRRFGVRDGALHADTDPSLPRVQWTYTDSEEQRSRLAFIQSAIRTVEFINNLNSKKDNE